METETIPADHFKCEGCGGVFLKGWSDQEAREEAVANFGGLAGEDDALFCDDCHEEFMKWLAKRQ